MDNVARTRQRVLAIPLPVTAVLYISAEALSPKGTDQVISTTATALKVLPIAARHPANSRTTRTSHDLAEARLADVTAPALVVMGEQDPDFPDPRAEGDWIARARR